MTEFIETKKQCKCGQLRMWADDQTIPINWDKSSDTYWLNITSQNKGELRFCLFCGGKELLDKEKEQPKCRCDQLAKWAALPGSCIHHDVKLEEHHLLYGNQCKLFCYYCPKCAGRLPESKNSQLFKEVSQEDRLELERRLRSANSLDEVIQLLGPPNERLTDSKQPENDKQIYGVIPIKTSVRYTRLAKTLDVVAQELEDGSLQILYVAKLISEK